MPEDEKLRRRCKRVITSLVLVEKHKMRTEDREKDAEREAHGGALEVQPKQKDEGTITKERRIRSLFKKERKGLPFANYPSL